MYGKGTYSINMPQYSRVSGCDSIHWTGLVLFQIGPIKSWLAGGPLDPNHSWGLKALETRQHVIGLVQIGSNTGFLYHYLYQRLLHQAKLFTVYSALSIELLSRYWLGNWTTWTEMSPFGEILVTACTESCHYDSSWMVQPAIKISKWWHFCFRVTISRLHAGQRIGGWSRNTERST